MIAVAVVGCGHMGTHHARVVAAHPGCRLVATIDTDPRRAEALALQHGAHPERDVPRSVDAVVVATPTTTHVEVAAPLLDRGQWCLVEKPLAHDVSAARNLDHPRAVVGHVERYNPALRAAGPLRPRYVEARRCARPTGRSRDIDVVLDLMIHDLDLVLWWSEGAEVQLLDAVGVRVQGEGIDHASVRLRTGQGLVASLTASRTSEHAQRLVRVYEDGRYTALDLLTGRASRAGRALPPVDGRDGLAAQWDAFARQVVGGTTEAVHARAGLRALELAERVRTSIREPGRP